MNGAYSVSLISTAGRSVSWTMLSGLSLSDISDIAILALPLYASDIANNQHYSFDSGLSENSDGMPPIFTAIDLGTSKDRRSFTRSIKNLFKNALSSPRSGQQVSPNAAAANNSAVFGVSIKQSIPYANSAISLAGDDGRSYIYGYVPIIVAKCGIFLKTKGE